MDFPQMIDSWRILSAIQHVQHHDHFDLKCPHPLQCHFMDALAETYEREGVQHERH